ncbi:MAG: hypothetical protein ACREOU_11005 [Candidatus Eiseniibacteriota bacterium]
MTARPVRRPAVSLVGVFAAFTVVTFAGGVASAFAAEPTPTKAPATPAPTAAKATTSAARPAPNAPVRRLEDFRIEGEIPASQVLFVTARDPYRFAEFQHRRYLKGSLALGQETVLPARFALVGHGPFPARKETAP